MQELASWDSFYLIIGPAAGALIGLQFILMTLVAQRPPGSGAKEAGAAFGTPTIVHFSVVLLIAAVLRAPWTGVTSAAIVWGLIGACGLAYIFLVTRRMRRQTAYRPEFEDWLFHCFFPLASYGILAVSALATVYYAHWALFAVGLSTLLLLFTGIHNAWDGTTFHVLAASRAKRGADDYDTERTT